MKLLVLVITNLFVLTVSVVNYGRDHFNMSKHRLKVKTSDVSRRSVVCLNLSFMNSIVRLVLSMG